MKPWRANLITICIVLASRLAAAQGAPPQGSSAAPPGARAQPAYPMSAAGAAQLGIPPQGGAPQPPQQPAGVPAQQQGYPGQPQSTKARGYPEPYYPPQGGALQQPPGFGAGAPGGQGPAPNETGEKPDDDLGHHGQLNFRSEFLTGYHMLYRYDSSPRCAPYDPQKNSSNQQKFCGFSAAPAVGLVAGFALVDYFEPFAFVRLGLANEAEETNQGKMLQMGIGARLYTMASSRFKFFFTPWMGVDATTGPLEPIGSGPPGSPGYDDALAKVKTGSYKTDILAHFDLGPQYDFSRGFGVYASGGLTFQFVRYFGASVDVAFGIQARAP